ncbi:MAG: hypothetical protein WDZ72_06085 [Cyclobacteriaceae bacterium]
MENKRCGFLKKISLAGAATAMVPSVLAKENPQKFISLERREKGRADRKWNRGGRSGFCFQGRGTCPSL